MVTHPLSVGIAASASLFLLLLTAGLPTVSPESAGSSAVVQVLNPTDCQGCNGIGIVTTETPPPIPCDPAPDVFLSGWPKFVDHGPNTDEGECGECDEGTSTCGTPVDPDCTIDATFELKLKPGYTFDTDNVWKNGDPVNNTLRIAVPNLTKDCGTNALSTQTIWIHSTVSTAISRLSSASVASRARARLYSPLIPTDD